MVKFWLSQNFKGEAEENINSTKKLVKALKLTWQNFTLKGMI
jgi:hypothetical protein